jgi:hypothetical protein
MSIAAPTQRIATSQQNLSTQTCQTRPRLVLFTIYPVKQSRWFASLSNSTHYWQFWSNKRIDQQTANPDAWHRVVFAESLFRFWLQIQVMHIYQGWYLYTHNFIKETHKDLAVYRLRYLKGRPINFTAVPAGCFVSQIIRFVLLTLLKIPNKMDAETRKGFRLLRNME